MSDLQNEIVSPFRRHPLDFIFAPRNVAVIGASESEGSVGRTILWNLIINPFGGAVFPVNPKRTSVLGIHAYPKIADVPAQVDLAVVVTPALAVPGVIEECVQAGVKGAIIISAGFKEIGKAGAQLEEKILRRARSAKMRIVGPNCLGVMSPITGLNATFAKGMARPGNVGFVSQSGALCTSVLDWSFREHVGFSAFVSVGSMLDVNWGDLIYYLGDDPQTKSIVMYMETIGNAESFLSAAREVSLSKPIIVIKAGRTSAAAKAAASHTGSLAGSDDVLDAAFRRCGVLRVDTLSHLFSMAEVLSKQPRPRGRRLTIVTNAGGPGVLATDALVEGGGELATLSTDAMKALDEVLPRHWSHNNPIDILGDASAKRYVDAVKLAMADPESDGLMVILTPQDMTYPTQTADQLREVLVNTKKPVLASWMGGPDVIAGVDILNRANIPTFDYPDMAARIFNYMWRYAYNLRSIYETPALPVASPAEATNKQRASQLLENIRTEGRTILTELESKQVFAAYGIPTVETHLAATADQAASIATKVGYPVVLKLNSTTITHKSDVQGVQLNLRDEAQVRAAYAIIEEAVTRIAGANHFQGVTVQPMIKLDGYELIVGSSQDIQFGPVLLFGTGGTLVEIFKDRALGLPPLNTTLARRMMEQTRIYNALKGVRGRQAIDLEALDRLLVRFSQLVVEQPRIKEIDINPLLASPEQIVALDARIVLHDPTLADHELPGPAIRPYPTQYISSFTLHAAQLENGNKDGSVVSATVEIRPIKPEDEPLMTEFTMDLSPDNLYLRYFHAVSAASLVSHEELARLTFVDYNREMALVAVRTDPKTSRPQIIAHGQLTKLHGSNEAEFAIQVRDLFQGTGLGTELLNRLLNIARNEGVERVVAEIMPANIGMRRICEKLGFTFQRLPNSQDLVAEIQLEPGEEPAAHTEPAS